MVAAAQAAQPVQAQTRMFVQAGGSHGSTFRVGGPTFRSAREGLPGALHGASAVLTLRHSGRAVGMGGEQLHRPTSMAEREGGLCAKQLLDRRIGAGSDLIVCGSGRKAVRQLGRLCTAHGVSRSSGSSAANDCARGSSGRRGTRERLDPSRSQRSRRRSVLVFAAKDSGQGSFWEGEEGKKKLDEIEELREILRAREELDKQLKELEEAQRKDNEVVGQGRTRLEVTEEDAAEAEARAKERAQKLRELLEKRAQEQVARRRKAEELFSLGQRAYGRGVYDKCVQILETALSLIEPGSRLGGEVQIWLAMAYDANGQRQQCLALYRRLEQTHPLPPIRKQAYDLRFIAEAPKLKLSPDEILTIPVLDQDNMSSQQTWSDMVRARRPKRLKPGASTAVSRDYLEDFWNTRPRWERSPYFWVALTLWLTLVGVALMFED